MIICNADLPAAKSVFVGLPRKVSTNRNNDGRRQERVRIIRCSDNMNAENGKGVPVG